MARSILLAAILAGCSGDREAAVERPRASLEGLWPSDTLLENGHLKITEVPLGGQRDNLADLAAALSELDGAPIHSSIFFPLTGDTLPDGPVEGEARLLDLTSGAARSLKLFHRAETSELVAMAPSDGVFLEGHRYACIVDDRFVTPSPAMRDALGGVGPFASIYAPIAKEQRVGAATVFTVGHPSRVLDAMRAQLDKSPAPLATVTDTIVDLDALMGTPTGPRSGIGYPEGVVHDALASVVLGTFEAPWYLGASTNNLGRVELDRDGAPIAKGTTRVPFLLALPKGAGAKTPILIFQHGLNASRAQVLAVANDYARAGYATIGIDALWHGSRRPGARDEKHAFGPAMGPDGLADDTEYGASTVFFDFNGDSGVGIRPLDARAVRDNFRQAVLEIGQLVRLIKKGDMSAITGVTFDPDSLVYTGESFGSVLGALTIAVDTDLRAAVLAVPGASIFLTMFPNSPVFAGIASIVLRGPFDPLLDVTDPVLLPAGAQRSLSLIQAAIEPGDPIAFAEQVKKRGRSVLMLQAFSDEVIANQAGELLVSAMDATEVSIPGHTAPLRYAKRPSASAPFAGGVAVLNVDPATHVMFTRFTDKRTYVPGFPPSVPLPKAQTIDEPTEWLHAVTLSFVDSYRKTGKPVVTAP